MKLVEVIKGKQTGNEVINRLIELTNELGKTAVVCKDSPGFIVNRVARPYYIESLRLAEEGVSDFDIIDLLLESQGFKLGPFKLMDLIGNDINYTVSCSVYDQLGQPERLKPSLLQKEKLDKGELGRKSKKDITHIKSDVRRGVSVKIWAFLSSSLMYHQVAVLSRCLVQFISR